MSLSFAPSSPEVKRAAAAPQSAPYNKQPPVLVAFTGSMFMFKKELLPSVAKYPLTHTVGHVLDALLKHNAPLVGKGSVGTVVHRGGKSTFMGLGTATLPCSMTLENALKVIPRPQWKSLEVLCEADTPILANQVQVAVGLWKKNLQWPLWRQGTDLCPLTQEVLGSPGCDLRDLVLVSAPGQPTKAASRTGYILAVAASARGDTQATEPVTKAALTEEQMDNLVASCGTLDAHILPVIELPACTVNLCYSKLFK